MSSRKIRASITGVYGYVPEYVLSNRELEKLVEIYLRVITKLLS